MNVYATKKGKKLHRKIKSEKYHDRRNGVDMKIWQVRRKKNVYASIHINVYPTKRGKKKEDKKIKGEKYHDSREQQKREKKRDKWITCTSEIRKAIKMKKKKKEKRKEEKKI